MGAEEAAGEAGHPRVSCPQGAQRQLCHVQLGGPREEGLTPSRVRVLRQKPAQRVYEETSFIKKTWLSAFSYAQSHISLVFCRSLGFRVPWSSSLTAESDLADFLCYVWRRRWMDFF